MLVADDNGSMRPHLRHVENDDKLQANVSEPSYLADPSHIIKTMCSLIYNMITNTQNPRKCENIDSLRVKKYTSCSIYQNKNSPIDDLI